MSVADSAPTPVPADLPIFADQVWQMNFGERAAMQGLLSSVRPRLAIEIGTAEGASLKKIAEHCPEVHSFDLVAPSLPDIERDGITLHGGDSHELLPRELARLAAGGRNVDFVLVDGDHSAAGVRQDIEDLLASDAIRETIIVAHDTSNEAVRAGLDAVDYAAFPKAVHVDLDLVPGHLGREAFPGELWGGLGLIIVSASRRLAPGEGAVQRRHEHHGSLLVAAREAGVGAPDAAAGAGARIAALQDEVEHHRALWQALMASPSWKATAPLRAAKRAARSRLGR